MSGTSPPPHPLPPPFPTASAVTLKSFPMGEARSRPSPVGLAPPPPVRRVRAPLLVRFTPPDRGLTRAATPGGAPCAGRRRARPALRHRPAPLRDASPDGGYRRGLVLSLFFSSDAVPADVALCTVQTGVGRSLSCFFARFFFPRWLLFISVYLHMYVRLPRLGAYRVLSGTPTV